MSLKIDKKEVETKINSKEVFQEIITMVGFFKDKLAADLVEGNGGKIFNVGQEELRKVNYVALASIDKSFAQFAERIQEKLNLQKW